MVGFLTRVGVVSGLDHQIHSCHSETSGPTTPKLSIAKLINQGVLLFFTHRDCLKNFEGET